MLVVPDASAGTLMSSRMSVETLPSVSTAFTTNPPPCNAAFQVGGAPASDTPTRAAVVVFTEIVNDAWVPGLTVMSGNCVVSVNPSAASALETPSGNTHSARAIESTARSRREIKVVKASCVLDPRAGPCSGRGLNTRARHQVAPKHGRFCGGESLQQ